MHAVVRHRRDRLFTAFLRPSPASRRTERLGRRPRPTFSTLAGSMVTESAASWVGVNKPGLATLIVILAIVAPLSWSAPPRTGATPTPARRTASEQPRERSRKLRLDVAPPPVRRSARAPTWNPQRRSAPRTHVLRHAGHHEVPTGGGIDRRVARGSANRHRR